MEKTKTPTWVDGNSIAIREAKEKEFTLIYNQCYDHLYENVVKIIFCEEMAKDFIHDVFMKLWINREQLHAIEDVKAYLFVAIRNMAKDHFKRENCFRKWQAHYQYTQKNVGFDDPIVQKEIQGAIEQTARTLPKRQYDVFILKKEYGLKCYEIGKVLSISPMTAKTHMKNANKYMKKRLKKLIEQ